MIRNIIRQVEPDCAELSYYFEGDCFSAAGGEYGYTLFIVSCDRWGRYEGLNIDEYCNVLRQINDLAEMFDENDGNGWYVSHYSSFKECMNDNGIPYNSRKCHKLKELRRDFDEEPESVAAFLTITTGKTWTVTSAHGYNQGDYVQMVYCVDHYTEKQARACGEIWLGAAAEFCVVDLDENGKEGDTVYGYIVADCEAWREEEYKALVCSWAGISEAETALQLIDYNTRSRYSYRTILPDGEEIDEEDFEKLISAA